MIYNVSYVAFSMSRTIRQLTQRLVALGLNLGVGPSRNLNVVIDDAGVATEGVERDVVPPRDRVAVLLEPDTPVLPKG
jgi:hypothetical protein